MMRGNRTEFPLKQLGCFAYCQGRLKSPESARNKDEE